MVARWQLLTLGLGEGSIRYRLSIGRLHQVHRSVYAVGHRRLTQQGLWIAATLACGPGALLSHRSAGALWDVCGRGRQVEVTVVGRAGRSRTQIRIHRAGRLDAEDRAAEGEIPVSSPARTLFDLAEVLDRESLERAFERAERRRLLDLRALDRVRERNPGRRALKPLAALLPSLGPVADLASELELCESEGIELPLTNTLVEGHEVDCLWPAARLVVELDSRAFHAGWVAGERDRRRDLDLKRGGYEVVRVTWRMLDEDTPKLLGLLRSSLRA